MDKVNFKFIDVQELSTLECKITSGGLVDESSWSYKIGEAVGFVVGGIVGTAERIIWTWGLPH
jgi:hypothetical protein